MSKGQYKYLFLSFIVASFLQHSRSTKFADMSLSNVTFSNITQSVQDNSKVSIESSTSTTALQQAGGKIVYIFRGIVY